MQGLEEIPELFADYLGITDAAAQVILSAVVILAIILPTMYLSQGKKSVTLEIAMLFIAICILVGISWLPFWVLIGTVCMMAFAVAVLGSNTIAGD